MTVKPYDYQLEASRLLAAGTTKGLSHEPGLGKSITSILACDQVGALNVLVLCMAVGKSHWANEFRRAQRIERPITIIHGHSQPVPREGVVIVNYDLISRLDNSLVKVLIKHQWDAVVLDEAHALKSRTSNRTKAVYGKRGDRVGGITGSAKHVFLATGTPAPSHSGELFTHLKALAPETITHNGRVLSEHEFVDRYCQTRSTPFGVQITGSKNIQDLRDRMGSFWHRLRKADVLKDLPPLDFQTLVVHPHDVKRVSSTVMKELAAVDMALAEHLDTAQFFNVAGDSDLLASVLRSTKMQEHLAIQRRITGTIKAEIAIDLVEQELAGNQKKIILFAHHTAVIDRLAAGLTLAKLKCVTIDGRSSPGQRVAAIQTFQSDLDTRVFIGQTQAAGTSITLTAASDVLFVEAPWVPSELVQAACRAHRIGQRDGVLARVLSLDGSIDKQIMAVLTRKARDIGALIDNEPLPEDARPAFPALLTEEKS